MNLTRFAPCLIIPALAIGCADAPDASLERDEAPATASASLDFTAAVGAVVVNGEKICTAALVDVDASAQVGGFSASGRQVVLGGACLGKLREGFIGGAAFVTQKNHLSISTPILAIDFSSAASAGFAVGILSEAVPDVKPMRTFRGLAASVHAGVKAATILSADENGLLVGASAELSAGVELDFKTKCTEWHFKAEGSIAVGASLSAGNRGFGLAAIVNVGGELEFAASIDGDCVAHQIKTALLLPLEAANSVADAFSQLGAGRMIATYDLKQRVTIVRVRFDEDATELRLNGQGRISGSVAGASCGPELIGACTLRPVGGFRKGSSALVTIDTHDNVIPDLHGATRVFVSVP